MRSRAHAHTLVQRVSRVQDGATLREPGAPGLCEALGESIVGHVGDGNFHMLILIDPAKPDEIDGAKALQARMVARAIAMDGTCTGEHGIGLGKIDYLVDELGEAVDVMRAIKMSLDPNGLMNPGKIFAAGARA